MSKHRIAHPQDLSHNKQMSSVIGQDRHAAERQKAPMKLGITAAQEASVEGTGTSQSDQAHPAPLAVVDDPDDFMNQMFDFDRFEEDQEHNVLLTVGGSTVQGSPPSAPEITASFEIPHPDSLSILSSTRVAYDDIDRMLAMSSKELRNENKEVLQPDTSVLTGDELMLRESLIDYLKTSEELDQSMKDPTTTATLPVNGVSRGFLHDPTIDPRAEAGIGSQLKPATNVSLTTVFDSDSLARLPGAEIDEDDERDTSLDNYELWDPISTHDVSASLDLQPHQAEETAGEAWLHAHAPERNRMAVPHEFQVPIQIQPSDVPTFNPQDLTIRKTPTARITASSDRQRDLVARAEKQGFRFRDILRWQHDFIPKLKERIENGMYHVAQRTCEAKKLGDQPDRIKQHFEALKSGALPKTYPPAPPRQFFTFAKTGSSTQFVKDSLDPADANKKEDELTLWKKVRKECLGYWDRDNDKWTQEPPAKILGHFRNAKIAIHVALQSQLARENVAKDLDKLILDATSERKKIWTPNHPMMAMCPVSKSANNPLNFPLLQYGQGDNWALIRHESTAWYRLKLDLDDLTKWLKQESARYESLQRVQRTAVQTTSRQNVIRSDKTHSKRLASGLISEAQLLGTLERSQIQGRPMPSQYVSTDVATKTNFLRSTSAAVANAEVDSAVIDYKKLRTAHQAPLSRAQPVVGYRGHADTATGLTPSETTQSVRLEHGDVHRCTESAVSWELIRPALREDLNMQKLMTSSKAQMLSDRRDSLAPGAVVDQETLAQWKSEINNLLGKTVVRKAVQTKFDSEKLELSKCLDLYDEQAHYHSVMNTVTASIRQQCQRASEYETWLGQRSSGQEVNKQLVIDFYVSLLKKHPRPPDMYRFIQDRKENSVKQYKHNLAASGRQADPHQDQMFGHDALQSAHEEWLWNMDKIRMTKALRERAAKAGMGSNPDLLQKISAEVTRQTSQLATDRQQRRDFWATYRASCQQNGMDPSDVDRRTYAERQWLEHKRRVDQESDIRHIYKSTLKDLQDRQSIQTGNQTTPEQDEQLKVTARKRADSYQRDLLALRTELKARFERQNVAAGRVITPTLQAQIERQATDAARRRYAEKNPGASVPGTPVSQTGSFLLPTTLSSNTGASSTASASSAGANVTAHNNDRIPTQSTVTSQAGSSQQSPSQRQTSANNETGANRSKSSGQRAARLPGLDGNSSVPSEASSPARKRPSAFEDSSPARKKPTTSSRKTSSTTNSHRAPPPTPKLQLPETGLGKGKHSGIGISGPSGTKRPPNTPINLVPPSPEPENQPTTLHKAASQMTGDGKSTTARPAVAKKGPKENVSTNSQKPTLLAPMAPMGQGSYAPRVPSPLNNSTSNSAPTSAVNNDARPASESYPGQTPFAAKRLGTPQSSFVEISFPTASSLEDQFGQDSPGQQSHRTSADFANAVAGSNPDFMLYCPKQHPDIGRKRKGDGQPAESPGSSKRQRPLSGPDAVHDEQKKRRVPNIPDWQWGESEQVGLPTSMVPPTPSQAQPPNLGMPTEGNDDEPFDTSLVWEDDNMIPDAYSHREDHFTSAIDPANDLGYNEANNRQSTRADGARGISVDQVGQQYGNMYRGPMPSYGSIMRDLHYESQEDLEKRAFNPRSYAVQQEAREQNSAQTGRHTGFGYAFNHESGSEILVRVVRPAPADEGVNLDHLAAPNETTSFDGDRPRNWKNW